MRTRALLTASSLLCVLSRSGGAEPPPVGATLSPWLSTAAGRELAEDARLDVKVSLAQQDRPLGELLPALGREIQVPLRARPDVADDKVTLFLAPRPASEVMALLARQFDFQWLRTGSGYELIRSGESKAREAARREQDWQEQWAAIQVQMERPPPLQGTPRRWLEEREATIAQRLESEDLDDGERSRLNEERSAITETMHPGREAARAIFRTLTAEQVRQLREGRDVWLSAGDGTLLPSLAREVEQAEVEAVQVPAWRWYFQLLGENGWPPRQTEVVLRLFDSVLALNGPPPRGEPHLSLLFLIPNGRAESRLQSGLLGWMAEGKRAPPAPPPTAAAADDPDLRHRVELELHRKGDPAAPADVGGGQSAAGAVGARGMAPLSAIAAALHRATGLEVVADSFIRARLSREGTAAVEGRPLLVAQILDRLARELDYTWRKEGNLILLRSGRYWQDRVEEAPERVLRPWKARVQQQGAASLDDLAALTASLTDAQVRGVHQYWEWYFAGTPAAPPSGEVGGFYGARHHLRFWASLTPLQRRLLFRGEILPVRWMSLWQRDAFARALQSPGASLFGATDLLRPVTPDEITMGGFGYRPALPPDSLTHTFAYYLAGEPESTREVEVGREPEPGVGHEHEKGNAG
jgi:hypothetical protein